MDQSQFQAYEVAGATDMNRLHQSAQDYFKEVVEGFIGDVSDALFGSAGFSSAIVAGPSIDITVAAQTFAAAGRIGSVGATVVNGVSSAPGDTQRFYIYLDIQETEVTESRDIANPSTGVKTPTMIVTQKTAAASVVVIQVDDGDPEAPPALGVISPGVERLGYIKIGYVDYNQTGVTNTDVFNSAGIFTTPGSTILSLNDLSNVSGAPGTSGQVLVSNGLTFTVQDVPRLQVRTVPQRGLINKAGAGDQTINLAWTAGQNPDEVPPNRLEMVFVEGTINEVYHISGYFDIDEAGELYILDGMRVTYDTSHSPNNGSIGFGSTAWATPTTFFTTASSCVLALSWTKATRTLAITLTGGANSLSGYAMATLIRTV